MKRLFLSVFAFVLGAFALVSCNDDEKIQNDDNDGGRFMTVPEQQQAIQSAMNGVADAIEFTEFSEALEVVSGIIGRDISTSELVQITGSPAFQEDSVMMAKVVALLSVIAQDTIPLDLSPINLSAYLHLADTVLVDSISGYDEMGRMVMKYDTIERTVVILDTIMHDVEGAQLNISVDGHEIVLKVNIKAGNNFIGPIKFDKDFFKTLALPKSTEFSIALDGKVLGSMNCRLDSDMSIYSDAAGNPVFDGTRLSLSGGSKVMSYALEGGLNYDLRSGINAEMTAKYSEQEILKINANLDADFESLDIMNTTSILTWAQNPDSLKRIGLNVSLAGGKVQLKAGMESPFKNEDLATILRSLMVPGATISDEKAKEAIEMLNDVINAGIYFEGLKEPQAKLRFVFLEESGTKAEADDESDPLDNIMELFAKTGAYPVLIAHDADGKEIEVQFEDYFGGIDVTTFAQTITVKFNQVFGKYLDNGGEQKK